MKKNLANNPNYMICPAVNFTLKINSGTQRVSFNLFRDSICDSVSKNLPKEIVVFNIPSNATEFRTYRSVFGNKRSKLSLKIADDKQFVIKGNNVSNECLFRIITCLSDQFPNFEYSYTVKVIQKSVKAPKEI